MSNLENRRKYRVAILGNPNSGKSSLFNALTGLSQKISNYPGVTVDKKSGKALLPGNIQIELIDFPGIYSLYPNSSDERIVVESLTNVQDPNYPDAILFVASGLELEKHFLLATQLRELGIPMVFCLSMSDIAQRKGIRYSPEVLSKFLDIPVVEVSATKNSNLESLKDHLSHLFIEKRHWNWKSIYEPSQEEKMAIEIVRNETHNVNSYQCLLVAHHHQWLQHISATQRINIKSKLDQIQFATIKYQIKETLNRYAQFTPVINKAQQLNGTNRKSFTERIDSVITHRFLGPLIFVLLMFLVFQAIYSWSEWPMTWIENFFAGAASYIRMLFPAGWFTDLVCDGIIAGLGGIMVFIPQIAILFLLISLLEEIGYMSRAVFMFDSIMQRFGMNGRSLVALISGGACAIPAIMSTRTIANWKERITTIMVTPLIACSARIPVFTVLVAFAVPKESVGAIFNTQGLAFMGLYLLGIFAALVSAFVFKLILKNEDQTFLMIELPQYKKPLINNILFTVKEKVSTFVVEAGKIILLVSIILWFLASYGPAVKMNEAFEQAQVTAASRGLDDIATEDLIASARLEASYAGMLGKSIEPVISPLGFDWKMGIALITSFAAREVFVGTMATIYSVGSTQDELTIRQKMGAEINPDTGKRRYDMATSVSLLLFYVFALQCMSTLAITKRETKSWKWPIIQFTYMGLMAYLSSLAAYQFLT